MQPHLGRFFKRSWSSYLGFFLELVLKPAFFLYDGHYVTAPPAFLFLLWPGVRVILARSSILPNHSRNIVLPRRYTVQIPNENVSDHGKRSPRGKVGFKFGIYPSQSVLDSKSGITTEEYTKCNANVKRRMLIDLSGRGCEELTKTFNSNRVFRVFVAQEGLRWVFFAFANLLRAPP